MKINPPSLVLRKQIIPAADKCQYLGIVIIEINCGGDLKRQRQKYYANANML